MKIRNVFLFTLPLASGFAEETLGDLGEVVVTASKLGEDQSKSLRSVGRVDAERLETKSARTAADAFRFLGNVIAPQDVDSGFSIRGVNSENFDANNGSGSQVPLITTFVDGVALSQQAARRGPLALWDVETIEVLRGPQSTLQGRNSIGGSVNIRTKDPTTIFEGATRVTYGEQGLFEHAGMLNVPLTESLFLRFSGEISESDSAISFPKLGARALPFQSDIRTSTSETFRMKALYEPLDSPFRSLFSYSYSTSSPSVNFAVGPNFPVLGANPGLSFFDRINDFSDIQVRNGRTHTFGWENTFDFSDTIRFTSMTGYVQNDLSVKVVNPRNDFEEDFTQEFRVNFDDDWGKAVFGIFGAYSDAESTQVNSERDRENLALFGEADFHAWDEFYLITGGRLLHDGFDFRSQGNTTVSKSDSEFLPKLGLRYEFDSEHTLGFSISRGYRAGGVEVSTAGDINPYDPELSWNYELSYRNRFFDDQLQLSANTFYNNRTDQQVVARSSIRNVPQDLILNAGTSDSFGAEVELSYQPTDDIEIFASVGYLNTQFRDFKIPLDPVFAWLPDEGDYRGYEFAQAPRWNGSIGVTYRPVNGFFVSLDGNFSSRAYGPYLFSPPTTGSGGQIQVPQDQSVELDSFFTANLSAGYEWESGRITVFVNNLFGDNHLLGQEPGLLPNIAAQTVDFYPGSLGYPSAPRLIGASLELSF